jgi:hypothetical protein
VLEAPGHDDPAQPLLPGGVEQAAARSSVTRALGLAAAGRRVRVVRAGILLVGESLPG